MTAVTESKFDQFQGIEFFHKLEMTAYARGGTRTRINHAFNRVLHINWTDTITNQNVLLHHAEEGAKELSLWKAAHIIKLDMF